MLQEEGALRTLGAEVMRTPNAAVREASEKGHQLGQACKEPNQTGHTGREKYQALS